MESRARSESEEGISVVDRSLVPPVNNALIFHFVSYKTIGIKDLAAALNAIWKPSSPVTLYAIGESIYMVGFENATDCNRVLAKQPWQLSNALMVFKKATGNEKVADLILNEVPFWVQIHGLEIQLHTRYVGELIGNKIGRVLEVDCSANSIAWGKCLRVRVLLNVTKPLIRGSRVEFNGSLYVVIFRYEKLGDFCFAYDKLDHLYRDYPNLFTNTIDSVTQKRQFESWLKSDGTKAVSVDELGKNFKSGNQQTYNQEMDMQGDAEASVGKGLAMQIMQYGSNINFMQEELQKAWVPHDSRVGHPGNSGGLECIFQGAPSDLSQLLNTTGFNQASLIGSLSIQTGTQINPAMETFYQIHNNQEWNNFNTWGTSFVPVEAGTNFIGEYQQSNIE